MKVGIDLTLLSRFIGKEDKISKKILTEQEKEVYDASLDKTRILSSCWATKEAIFKATHDAHYLKYSLLHEDDGTPYIENHPEMKVSLSHDGDYVVAIVLIEEN